MPFCEALNQAGDADLVDHLGQLAGARGPEPLAHACIGGDHRLGAGIGVFAAAAHHRQHAVFRAGLSAGHRRIDEFEAGLGGGGVEFAGDLGRGRGVVDEGGAFLHAGKSAIGADRDGAEVVIVADAGHDEILAFRGRLRRRCGLALEFLGPCLALAGVRLYTVTSWPPLATRCPAMGKPMTPRPRKATLAIGAILGFCRRIAQPGMIVKGDGTLPQGSKQAPP